MSTENKLTRLIADVARGKDVEEFVDATGWDSVLLPDLLREREQVVKALVLALLDPASGDRLAVACGLAGQIHGIDLIIRSIEGRIATGRRAHGRALEEGFIPKV